MLVLLARSVGSPVLGLGRHIVVTLTVGSCVLRNVSCGCHAYSTVSHVDNHRCSICAPGLDWSVFGEHWLLAGDGSDSPSWTDECCLHMSEPMSSHVSFDLASGVLDLLVLSWSHCDVWSVEASVRYGVCCTEDVTGCGVGFEVAALYWSWTNVPSGKRSEHSEECGYLCPMSVVVDVVSYGFVLGSRLEVKCCPLPLVSCGVTV